jgi:hypothetical protein
MTDHDERRGPPPGSTPPPDDAWAFDGATEGALEGDWELLEADEPHATRMRPATAVTAMVRHWFTRDPPARQ